MKKILFFTINSKIKASIGFKRPMIARALNRHQLEYDEYQELPDEDDGFVSASLDDYIVYRPDEIEE